MIFGFLKVRFYCFYKLRVNFVRVCDIIVVCVVFYNVVCLRKERVFRVLLVMDWDNSVIFFDDDSGRLLRD